MSKFQIVSKLLKCDVNRMFYFLKGESLEIIHLKCFSKMFSLVALIQIFFSGISTMIGGTQIILQNFGVPGICQYTGNLDHDLDLKASCRNMLVNSLNLTFDVHCIELIQTCFTELKFFLPFLARGNAEMLLLIFVDS